MTEPTRIRTAVVVSSLAGDDIDDLAALSARDRASAERLRSRLRASGDRRRVAAAIVAERFAAIRARQGACAVTPAALLYARWLRSMDTASRERVARSLDDASAAAIASRARSSTPLVDPARTLTAWMMAVGARALGRMPTVSDLASLLDALRGDSDVSSSALVRWERSVRVAGRREACEALARSMAGEP